MFQDTPPPTGDPVSKHSNHKVHTVEFVGLPGSGKTSICREVLRLQPLSNRQVGTYRDIFSKGGSLNRAILKNGGIVDAGIVLMSLGWGSLGRCTHPRFRCRRLLRVAEIVRRFRRSAHAFDVVVLDQGPLQALFSWFWAGGRMPCGKVNKLLEHIYNGIALHAVFVDVAPAEAFRRMRVREQDGGRKLFRFMSDDEVSKLFSSAIPQQELLRASLDQIGADVTLLDGTREPTDNAQLLLASPTITGL